MPSDVHSKPSQSDIWLKQLFCGGMAGAAAKTTTAPLSRLAMLFQVHSLVSPKGLQNPSYASSLPSAFSKVWTREGFLAFWKGNGTSCMHRFPYSAINFAVYEKAQGWMGKGCRDEDGNSWRNITVRFLSGACAGTSAVIFCYPLDLIRTRLTTQQPATKYSYNGITDAAAKIVKYDGIGGLYVGLGTTLCVAVPSFSISYMVYGSLKEYVLDDERFSNFRKVGGDGSLRMGTVGTLFCGATSGSITAVVTYPIDVTRRRLQVQSQYIPEGQRMSAMDIFKGILKDEGTRGLYRGIVPELLKVVPFVGTMFGVYEVLREQFKLNTD
mmetsp:Transcript_19626/g.36524  ORF Transcript_19626/g.36524 Transcript_19626/m.36524 type:complete len:326 (+) Transcript_19626:190-1167(+)